MGPRPLARASRPSLVLQRVTSRIPPAAVERLVRLAERQSEGALDRKGVGTPTYFGSTYFTFRVESVRDAFAGTAARTLTAEELGRRLAEHPLLRLRLVRAAREEAERRIQASAWQPGGKAAAPGTARAASTVSPRGDGVVVEVALEIPCPVEGG